MSPLGPSPPSGRLALFPGEAGVQHQLSLSVAGCPFGWNSSSQLVLDVLTAELLCHTGVRISGSLALHRARVYQHWSHTAACSPFKFRQLCQETANCIYI